MSDQFKPSELVNIEGRPWRPSAASVTPVKRITQQSGPSHKGWRVVGHPPGALEAARKEREVEAAKIQGDWDASAASLKKIGKTPSAPPKLPKPWDAQHWLMAAKKKPVRSKPYEVPEAAALCKEMALKAGWLGVEIVELKKD